MTRRPWGTCLRWDGTPKLRLTEAEAAATVERVNAENRSLGRQPVSRYLCSTCGWWHTGKGRRAAEARRSPTLMVELGDRAWWCLVAENFDRAPEARARAIATRWRRIVRDRACT